MVSRVLEMSRQICVGRQWKRLKPRGLLGAAEVGGRLDPRTIVRIRRNGSTWRSKMHGGTPL